MKQSKFNSTIEEVLSFCAVPNDITDRKELLLDASEQFPGLDKFIEYSFGTPTEEVIEALKDFPAQRPVSKLPNKQMALFSDFMLKTLPKLKEVMKKSPSAFRAQLIQEMDFLEPRDFTLIRDCLQGIYSFPNKKINEVVLEMAFPHAFPNQ